MEGSWIKERTKEKFDKIKEEIGKLKHSNGSLDHFRIVTNSCNRIETIIEEISEIITEGNSESEAPFNQTKCNICGEEHLTKHCVKKGRIPAFKNTTKFQIQNAGIISGCQNCTSPYHLTEACSLPKIENETCESCHKKGHNAAHCIIPCQLCKKTGHTIHQCVARQIFGCTNCRHFGHTERECLNYIILCQFCGRTHSEDTCPFKSVETAEKRWIFIERQEELKIQYEIEESSNPELGQISFQAKEIVTNEEFKTHFPGFRIDRRCNHCNKGIEERKLCNHCGKEFIEKKEENINQEFEFALTRPAKSLTENLVKRNIKFHNQLSTSEELKQRIATKGSEFWKQYWELSFQQQINLRVVRTSKFHTTIHKLYCILSLTYEQFAQAKPNCKKKQCQKPESFQRHCNKCQNDLRIQIDQITNLLALRVPYHYLPKINLPIKHRNILIQEACSTCQGAYF